MEGEKLRHGRTYKVVSTAENGLAPKVTNTANYLKGDGTWAAIASGGDMLKATYDPDLDGLIALAECEADVAGTADITTHAAAATGVHGAGTATIATTADITTHAGAANPHTVYLLKQMAENDPILLDAVLSGTGTYSGIAEAGVADAALAFGQACYLKAGSTRWALATASGTATAKQKMGMCVLAATGAAGTTTMLLFGKISASVLPSMTVGEPLFITATAGTVSHTAAGTTGQVVRAIGHGNSATEMHFSPDNTWVELA